MHLGMKVRHPQYGVGVVKSLAGQMAEVLFENGPRQVDPNLSGLEPAESQVEISGLQMPLALLLEQAAEAVINKMGVEKPGGSVNELAPRWQGGKMVLHPYDPTLQTKEVPLEVFFHKIVMMRNNFRVLEQKVNSCDKLTDVDKFDIQQYITRCYGSMTTFNLLFKSKEDQFTGSSVG